MQPYTSSMYEPNGYGRYRQYPRRVVTPIPGAGYDVGEMVWAEQELNLDGGEGQNYGNYSTVPLRGLGLGEELAARTISMSIPSVLSPSPGPGSGPTLPVPTLPVPTLPGPALPAGPGADQPPLDPLPEELGFFRKRVGPVPVWAIFAGAAVAAVGGGTWWYLKA